MPPVTDAATEGPGVLEAHTNRRFGVPALAGAVFVVLMIINGEVRGAAPAATDSGREILGYLARHHDRFQLGAVALGLAMSAALMWLSASCEL
jgi:hypothetical protein